MNKKNMYIGNRYTPIIDGIWDNSKQYESMTIVLWKGASYTSKKFVPKGISINNENYWSLTGNYNYQIENYRKIVERVEKELNCKTEYDTNNEIAVTRLGRIINSGAKISNDSKNGCIEEPENNLSNPQGFCFDGVYYYCAYREYNGTGDDKFTKIVKYDSTFKEVASIIGNFGHGNTITTDGKDLYISGITTKLYKIRAKDLKYLETLDLDFGFYAATYFDKAFYILTNNKIRKTKDFKKYDDINYKLPSGSGVAQGFDFDGKHFYMLRTSPNVILQYDIKGNLKYIFRLPWYADNVFKIGEVEDLSIIDDNIYFNAVMVDTDNVNETNSIFRCNIKKNITGLTYQNFIELNKIREGYSLFVDNTNNNPNPLGTFSNPFKSLSEALEFVSNNVVGNCQINIKDSVSELDEHIFFRGTFNNVIINSNKKCKIKNLTLGRCNVTLTNILCDEVRLYNAKVTGTIGFKELKCYSSDVTLYGSHLNNLSPISLYGSTLNGVPNLNVNVYDFGCHGTFIIDKILAIGESYNNTLISKAKTIIVSLECLGKKFTSTIMKESINDISFNNIFNGSAGAEFVSYHISKNGDNIVFNDVRIIDMDKNARTLTSQTPGYIITGFAFIL